MALPVEFVLVDPAVMIGVTQAGGRILIEDHGCAGVQLEGGPGADGGEWTLDHVLDGANLGRPECEQEDSARVEDGADAHGESVLRHVFEGAENGTVILEGLLGEDFYPRAGAQRAGGFVEADVTIAPQTEQLDINATRIEDALFVTAAFDMHVLRRAIGDVGVLLINVDMLEKMLPHEPVVGLIMGGRQTDIFVEVEGCHPTEVQILLAVETDQFPVEHQRGATRGEAEHGVGFFPHNPGDDLGGEKTTILWAVADDDFHDGQARAALSQGETQKLSSINTGGLSLRGRILFVAWVYLLADWFMRSSQHQHRILLVGVLLMVSLVELSAQRRAAGPAAPMFTPQGSLDKIPTQSNDSPRKDAVAPRDAAPVAVTRVRPQYPLELRKANITGEVVVEFIINKKGDVVSAHAVRSTNPGFEAAAIEAVQLWKFRPGLKNGRKVNTRMQVPIVFNLEDVAPQSVPPLIQTPVRVNPLSSSRPVYPYYALLENSQGVVECAVLCSATGTVSNVAWRGEPDEEFKLAIEAWLDATKFIPATESGKAVAHVQDFKLIFNPLMGDVRITDEAAAILKRLRLGGVSANFPNPKDLDQNITPLEQKSPTFPSLADPGLNKGDALIEFFVDETGHAQLPHIITASEPVFGYAACQAIAAWRFTPPLRDGKPAVVKLRVPVEFTR